MKQQDLVLQIGICRTKGWFGRKCGRNWANRPKKMSFIDRKLKKKEKSLQTNVVYKENSPQEAKFRPYFSRLPANCNLYAYGANNPVHYIDPDGREAGDFFDSADEAAKDFAMTYNDDSIKNNVELGTYIREKDGKFYYDILIAGNDEGIVLSSKSSDKDIIATIHTHGAYFEAYINEDGNIVSRSLEFSNDDLKQYNKTHITSYVAVPTGELFVVDGFNRETGFQIGVFESNFPSDPKCPIRKNSLDASTFPDNIYIK